MLVMAEGDGEVSLRDPDELIKEIERTRESLARTIDALADRVSPGNVARRGMFRLREQMARPEIQVASGAAALMLTAAIVYRLWRRRK